jgi:hypothetical protein
VLEVACLPAATIGRTKKVRIHQHLVIFIACSTCCGLLGARL